MEWHTTYDADMGEVTVMVRFGMTEIEEIERQLAVTPDQFINPYLEQIEADLRLDFMGVEE